jgi:O-antigen ligase
MALSSAWLWELTLAGVAIFPILPIFGGVALLVAAWQTWQRKKFPWRSQSPLVWGLGILTLWLLASSLFAEHAKDAWLGIANFLPFFLIFLFFSHIIAHPFQLRQLAWRLVLPSFAVVFLGAGQLAAGWETPSFLRNLTVDQIYPYGQPEGRMSSLFMYANTLAAYLLVLFILSLGLALDTYIRNQQSKTQTPTWQLLGLGLVVVGNGLGLIFTNSRNAWGLAFGAIIVFAIYWGWRWLGAMFMAIATAISIAAWGPAGWRELGRRFVPAFIWLRLSDELYKDSRPLPTLRTSQWQFAWEKLWERPWFGWGLRNFTPLYEQKTGIWLGHPHNLYLMLGLETGFVGLGLFCLWVGAILGPAYRLCGQLGDEALIFFTYLLAFTGCIFFNMLDVTVLDGKLNALNWMILGAIGGLVRSKKLIS